jgi:hypothetical protein
MVYFRLISLSIMLTVLLMRMKPARLLVAALLLFCSLRPTSLRASNGGSQPSTAAQAPFTIDDFDWREMVPYLFAAATLPGKEGIETVLENSKVLRSYVTKQVQIECKRGDERCDSSKDGFTVNGEVTKRIDGIVREGMRHRNKTSYLDYAMDGKSFPFSEIAAMRSDRREDAYFLLQFPDHSYTVAQVQAKYGVPYDTDIVQWYSVYKYRLDSAHYTSKAVFEIDPTDGAVLKVAISLKTRKHR